MKPILILDSDPSFTQLLVQRLRLEGYAVTSAKTISEAQALLNEIQPLLICSDLILPDGNGFDLLGYTQEVMPTVPFIMMSGHNQKILCDEAIRQGATHCICKSEIVKLQATIMDCSNQVLPAIDRFFLHRVLYVCADLQKGGVLRASIRQNRYHTIVVDNLKDAQETLLNGLGVEMILCDAIFPHSNAVDFLKLLRESAIFRLLDKNVPPCIVIMGREAPLPAAAYFQEGALDCIPAPVNIPLLVQTMQNYFEMS